MHLAQLLSFTGLALLLSACGGSSGNDSGSAALGRFEGRVLDAVNGAPLADASVRAAGGEEVITGADGRFVLVRFETNSQSLIQFSRDGYRDEDVIASTLDSGSILSPDPQPVLVNGAAEDNTIRLVPDDLSGIGGLAGSVTGSDGQAIAGVTLRFLRGLQSIDGDAEATTTTDADGNWSVVGLPYGNYLCIILIAGQEPIYHVVQVYGGVTRTGQNVSVPVSSSAVQLEFADGVRQRRRVH